MRLSKNIGSTNRVHKEAVFNVVCSLSRVCDKGKELKVFTLRLSESIGVQAERILRLSPYPVFTQILLLT